MAELGEMLTNLGKNVPTKVPPNNAVFSESQAKNVLKSTTFYFEWTLESFLI